MHLGPAEYVIHVFRGVRAAARALGRDPSSVSKWRLPKERKGCDGFVPGPVRQTILTKARELGLDIDSEDLDYGRDIILASDE